MVALTGTWPRNLGITTATCEALLAAALDLLEEDGLDKLSLRRVAARVGVSHAAPAHHFPTMRSLQTALATIGFVRFDAAMREARDAASPDPMAQLRAAERGYLRTPRRTRPCSG